MGAAETAGMAVEVAKRRLSGPPGTTKRAAHEGAVAAAVGVGVLTVAALVVFGRKERADAKAKGGEKPPAGVPSGHPLCPGDAGSYPADLTGLKVGDFVVVTLANTTNTLRESTWARVLGTREGRVTVELVGEMVPGVDTGFEAVPRSLKTEWHGFHVGQKLFMRSNCIWDVLHRNPQPGAILCGMQGRYAFGHPPLAERHLAPGFRVRIALAPPQGRVSEPIWAEVLSVSPTGSVITARLLEQPQIPQHGFALGDVVQFARDCVFEVEPV